MHVQYRKRVAAQIDAENMALAERILNQKGRHEISQKSLSQHWQKASKTSKMLQKTSAVKISTIVQQNEEKYSYIKPQIREVSGGGANGGTGGTVLPPLKKLGERKRSGNINDYGSQPVTTKAAQNSRRAKSLVKPRPAKNVEAQFST